MKKIIKDLTVRTKWMLGVFFLLLLASGFFLFSNKNSLSSSADSVIQTNVTEKTALQVARNFITVNPAPMIKDAKGNTWRAKEKVKQFKNSEGALLAYVVDLEPRGYIIVPANNALEPVIAFSTESNFENNLDSENHLTLLLSQDIPAQVKNQAKLTSDYKTKVRTKWSTLSSSSIATKDLNAIAAVTPVVNPLITTTWSQGNPSGPYTYNYYTPNHYFTGCVMTAMAQVIKHYEFPASASFEGGYYLNGRYQNYTVNSRYNYSSMPDSLSPSSALPEIQEVGKLMVDLGAIIYASYGSSETSGNPMSYVTTLPRDFGYNSAQWTTGLNTNWPNLLKNELNSGYPVFTAVNDLTRRIGHAVVTDGWGTLGGSEVAHINMGWGGSYNGWYTLPGFSTGGYVWDSLNGIIHNLRAPSNSGDTIAPTINITAPTDRSINDGTIDGMTRMSHPFQVTASDNVGVTRVEFYIDNNLIGTDTTSPYTKNFIPFSLTAGPHTFTAKAYDQAGNSTTSSPVNITIRFAGTSPSPSPDRGNDTISPTVSIVSPVPNSILRSLVNFTISASDNIGVTKVELYRGTTLISTDSTSPYSFYWNSAEVSNGTYSLTAKAYDAAGNIATSSAVNYIVGN